MTPEHTLLVAEAEGLGLGFWFLLGSFEITLLLPPHACCLPQKLASPSSFFLIQFLFLLVSA